MQIIRMPVYTPTEKIDYPSHHTPSVVGWDYRIHLLHLCF